MAAPYGAEAVEEEMADDVGGLRDYFLVSEEGPELDYVVGRLEFPAGPDRAQSCEVIPLVEQNGRCLLQCRALCGTSGLRRGCSPALRF